MRIDRVASLGRKQHQTSAVWPPASMMVLTRRKDAVCSRTAADDVEASLLCEAAASDGM